MKYSLSDKMTKKYLHDRDWGFFVRDKAGILNFPFFTFVSTLSSELSQWLRFEIILRERVTLGQWCRAFCIHGAIPDFLILTRATG